MVRLLGAQGVRELGAEGSAGQQGWVWPVRVLVLVASESLQESVWARPESVRCRAATMRPFLPVTGLWLIADIPAATSEAFTTAL